MPKFIEELSRRNVFKVALAYIVGGWIVIQVAETLFPNIGLPDTAVTLVIGLIIVGFPLALILSWVFDVKPDAGPIEEQATDTGPSIAVLPFPDMSAERDQEHFCDGLTEELLNVLTCIPGLRVASRTSSFSLKGKQVEMKEVAQRFNVRHILEGSVRKSGDRIRVTAQLIEADTDTHLWSETYDRELDDIFAIQDDIAARILEKLKLQLGTTRTAADETSDAKAYEYYLRGRGYRISKSTRGVELAASMFSKAVDLDPGFISAWVNLAEMGAVYAVFYGDEQEWMAVSAQAGEKLQELAPGEGVAYLTEGYSLTAQSKFDDAIQHFKKALEIDSSLYIAWEYMARAQQHLGRSAEAADSYARGADCDPDNFESPSLATTLYRSIGDDRNAKKYALLSVQRSEENLKDYPENTRALYLGAGSMTVTGEIERGARWIERALSIDDKDMATRYNSACFYANVGEIEKALDLLEGSIIAKEWIEHDPDMDSLRDHPRYRAVLESLQSANITKEE